MASLLGSMRRERNGAVADAMFSYGRTCGLNYGVSLSTVRSIARAQTPDHDFARYLWQQDVRELRLAALHLSQPERLTSDEFGFWAAGIVNSELAEEAAFALLSRSSAFPELFEVWLADENPLLQYAALMAASRVEDAPCAWIESAVEAVRRSAANSAASPPLTSSSAHLIARGAVALLTALGSRNEENRHAVFCATGSLGKLPTEDFVHEELSWLL